MADKNSNKTKKSEIALREEATLKFWQENDIFNKTLEKDSPKGEYVFYEGPPTANAPPAIHHLESRAFKDIIPRYKTMQGYHVRRKAGWDTHGLPVELQVEKKLGLDSKKDIEKFGIEKFNAECLADVLQFIDAWREFSERIAFWQDYDNAYYTFNADYMESLWHVLKTADDRKLLYKDYKVVPWCPRCGTALSSHEIAQGYQMVKDLSVYVAFEAVDEKDTFYLAWTTTPWTLPGNVALAVGLKITYAKVLHEKKHYILAKELVETVFEGKEYEVVEELLGEDLTGHEYKPLYPFIVDNLPEDQHDRLKNAYHIYAAPFVTTEEGTGIVHTAVMYGQDDFVLGKEVGLPRYHLVDEWGHFTDDVKPFKGRFVKEEATDVEIIKDLAKRGTLFKKVKYEHNYPHCWRCKTPLIYYARDSWYIRMSDLRSELIAGNEKINWEPDYIKQGRFGEWIADVKDWAISRERYWGTPLPVWVSEDGVEQMVIGSVEDLRKHTKTAGNTYYITRHGESESNVARTLNCKIDPKNTLTEKGIEQAKKAAKELKKKDITIIYCSPLQRTKQTAEIIAEELVLEKNAVVVEESIREQNFGDMDGKSLDEYHKLTKDVYKVMTEAPKGGDTWRQTKTRMTEFLYSLEEKHQDTPILIVSHNGPMQMLQCGALGCDDKQAAKAILEDTFDLENAEIRKLEFAPLPHNDDYELDLHRPHIDDVVLVSKKGTELHRTPEVMDVWFDSGGMPYAQDHYPFENKEFIEKKGFPADYICEAIDQTRGWFYTLHAESVIMNRSPAFKNVICLGHLMDAEGKKMSKSVGNVVDPWEMANKYGVDVLRMWMYSVNQPGEPKNFDEKTVVELQRKIFNLLENIVKFYELYKDEVKHDVSARDSKHVLDQWVLTRTDQLVTMMTKHLDDYKVLEPARAMRDFIGEFSQWYVRRSRDRLKETGSEDQAFAVATTREVVLTLAKLIAPFAPFASEDYYKRVAGELESIHLETWPTPEKPDQKLMSEMEHVRSMVSFGLEARASAGIKVRQPLRVLMLQSDALKGRDDLIELIKDEVNVKEVGFDKTLETEAVLDTSLTKALKEEGDVREIIRHIQSLRKEKKLQPTDTVDLKVKTDTAGKELIEKNMKEIQNIAGIGNISFGSATGNEVATSESSFTMSLS